MRDVVAEVLDGVGVVVEEPVSTPNPELPLGHVGRTVGQGPRSGRRGTQERHKDFGSGLLPPAAAVPGVLG
jgi:hypothetical protein